MADRGKITGVIPAALTPFDAHGAIHTDDLAGHLAYLVGTPGVAGVTVTAEAGEVESLTREEQRHVLTVAREVTPDSQWLVAGLRADSTTEAEELAGAFAEAGADALLVFPPQRWRPKLRRDPRAAYDYYKAIANASELPLIAFVYPTWSALHLGPDVVLELCAQVPNVAAIRESSNDIVILERTVRGLRAEHPHVSVLSNYSSSLLTSLALGADGILTDQSSLVPELHCALLEAVVRRQPTRARELAAVVDELTRVVYAPPIADRHARLKLACAMLGRISHPHVREPLRALDDDQAEAIAGVLTALRSAGGRAVGARPNLQGEGELDVRLDLAPLAHRDHHAAGRGSELVLR
jgi:4-hydroxy-tetrahydrodipicolinate synthase